MSFPKIESITIPPELEAEMTPAVRAFVKTLLERIGQLEARVKELEGGRKTPRNSSLPPSTVHPHAKPASTKRRSKKKRGGRPSFSAQSWTSPVARRWP